MFWGILPVAAGQRIGDFDDLQIMGAVQAQIEGALQYSGQRFHPEFASLAPDAVFRRLHAALYGEGDTDSASTTRYAANDLSRLGVEGVRRPVRFPGRLS
jgi:hypothetical protein